MDSSKPALQRVLALSLLLCASRSSAAVPTILSVPLDQVGASERYRYDADGLPQATGGGKLTWSLPVAPSGMDLDNLTGELFWLPDVPGDYPVELAVRNADGEARQSFIVKVTAQAPPVVQPVGIDKVRRGEHVRVLLSATGASPRFWEAVAVPSGALLNASTGELTWSPAAAGTFTLDVAVTNPVGRASYTWVVEVVDAPLPSPTPLFSILPGATGEAPLFPIFDASASLSNHAGSPYLNYAWDFGDGTPTTSGGFVPLVAHAYPQAGAYSVKLTVTNLYAQSAELIQPVVVTSLGRVPPTVIIRAKQQSPSAPATVDFECDCRAGDAPILSYDWDYGDGQGSRAEKPSHIYGTAAGYNVKLTVTDAEGLQGYGSAFVPVARGALLPPFASARVTPRSGDAPLQVRFVPEVGDPDGTVSSVRWELSDGTQATNEPTRTLTALGTFTARLIVVDNDGLETRDTVEAQVTRNGMLPPKIVSLPATQASVGQPYLYDEDGRAAARGTAPLAWELGKNVSGALVNAPEGMTVDPATGRLHWTPTLAQSGEVRVSLLVRNQAGVDVQDFVITVAGPGEVAPAGCGCGAVSPAPFALAALLLLAARRRRS